jgi:hypothetical protein
MAARSGVIGRSKKLGAFRQACECADPMNAYPIMPTRKVRVSVEVIVIPLPVVSGGGEHRTRPHRWGV